MLTARELKALLAEHSLRLSKRLGQNYLIDRNLIARLMRAFSLTSEDRVLEIGAGLGALTEPLAEQAAHVLAFEVDQGIAELLVRRLAGRPNVEVAHSDFLAFDWSSLRHDVTVIGAIPYTISSEILARLCENRTRVRRAWLIVQKEVGQRLAAKPATKAYGRLTVLGQYSWTIQPQFSLPRGAFFPQPAVDSVLLRLDPREPGLQAAAEAPFFSVVKAVFAQRRKTLLNGLLDAELVSDRAAGQAILQKLGYAAAVRGEELSPQELQRLASALR